MAAEVQLFAWWVGDALRDVTCAEPDSLVQGPFTVFQVDGDEQSVVVFQPDEATAASDQEEFAPGYGAWAVRSSGAGLSGEDLFRLGSFEYWTDFLPPR